jgi:uncharacterized protein
VRTLLDVNVLIALLDVDHVSHREAQRWMAAHGEQGWATSPVIQNGCVRIMSGRGYPNPLAISDIVRRLRVAVQHPLHEFWPDELSLLDPARFDEMRILGPAQLTDVYLLALAVSRRGRLLTLDRRITISAVHGARDEHLVII